MQILNLGVWEFLLILFLALIVMGPDNMILTGRRIGRFIRSIVKSPIWAEMLETSREIRELPTKIIREAGIEETMEEIKEETQGISQEISSAMDETAKDLDQTIRESEAETVIPVNPLTGEPMGANVPLSGISRTGSSTSVTADALTQPAGKKEADAKDKEDEVDVQQLEGEALVYFAAGLPLKKQQIMPAEGSDGGGAGAQTAETSVDQMKELATEAATEMAEAVNKEPVVDQQYQLELVQRASGLNGRSDAGKSAT